MAGHDWISDEEFLGDLHAGGFERLIGEERSPGYHILTRPDDKHEFAKNDGLSLSDGGFRGEADIVVFAHNEGGFSDKIYIFGGARFELEGCLATSYLRKVTYDRVHNYPGIHRIHTSSPGSRRTPFEPPAEDQNTPYKTVRIDRKNLDETKRRLIVEYEGLKRYFEVIDSPTFEELVNELRSNTSKALEKIGEGLNFKKN